MHQKPLEGLLNHRLPDPTLVVLILSVSSGSKNLIFNKFGDSDVIPGTALKEGP